MKKTAVPSDEKIDNQDFDLFKAIEAIDRKDYTWFSKLTDEQKKKFVPYMLIRWISAVKGAGMLSGYYVMSTDVNANRYMFNERIQHHPELQWLMLCASSPGIGKQFHQWIPQLSERITSLKDAAKLREVKEFFDKVYKGNSEELIKEYAQEFTAVQNKKYRLADIHPNMKLSDIETLSNLISHGDLDEYDKQSGN